MKDTLEALLLASMMTFTLNASGQTSHVAGGKTTAIDKPADQEVIDKVKYRITYASKAVDDTTRRDSTGGYDYSNDDMRLDVGASVSKFYSARTAEFEKWIKDKVARGEKDFSNLPPNPSIGWVVYRNYPKGQTSFLSNAMMDYYRISEATVTPKWTICSDTCTLIGYHCTKAETFFKGRHWTAWFTEDIPLNEGPWKLIGLPGLILKAEDTQKQYIFVANGLEQINGKEDITLVKDYKKYESVTQKQFDKINRTSSAADALKAAGITISASNLKVEGGDAEDVMNHLIDVPPYNPIEIAE